MLIAKIPRIRFKMAHYFVFLQIKLILVSVYLPGIEEIGQ
jgi:hypothetical protein